MEKRSKTMSYKKGKGGIQEGSTKNDGAGISTKSQIDERLHEKIVSESVDKVLGFPLRKGWVVKKKEKLVYLTEKTHGWGIRRNGSSTELVSDGYFVYYNNKLVGITEHKRQNKEGNACERFCKYIPIAWKNKLEPWQIFGSFSGAGFYKPILNFEGGGQTGATIEILLDLGVTVLTNPTEEELGVSVREWINKLIDKYES
tara:strand:- start:1069 stop:1671 length:603 start_codon:yes stop_codon:yes gene_type:complete